MNQKGLTEVNQTIVSQLRQQLDQLNDETSRLTSVARNGVKILKQSKRGDKNTRQNQYKASVENLRQAVQSFFAAQKEVRTTNRDQIVRQYKIARPDASDQQIEQAVEEGRTDIFNSAILSSRVQDQQRILGAVQDRQRSLEKIAASMNELVQMTVELQALIEDQQGMIDLIEETVEGASNYVKTGDQELTKAVDHAKAARRKKWIVFWIIIVILVVVGAAIGIYIALNKGATGAAN